MNIGKREKVALITGGGGGIGRVSSKLFASRGYRVAVADVNLQSASEVAAEIKDNGGCAYPLKVDISQANQVESMFARLEEHFGRLDAAFNNAGVGGGGRPLADIDEAEWQSVLQINLSGTWRCMKYEIELMQKGEGGAIVNNCSIMGLNGGASATYTATKHGIAGLTKSGAFSYAKQGIRVNAVCPGLIEAGLGLNVIQRDPDTMKSIVALHPAGRPGTALEVANAALWLCSDEASFIHGHLLPVDGGYCSR